MFVYPPQKFENVFSNDEVININDTEAINKFISQVLEELDKFKISTERLTFEFILPIELFNQPFEQWLNNDNNPIGAFSPVVIRSQERLKRQELKRLWKQIQPDLETELNSKIYWLDKPNAKIIYQHLKSHVCFAMQFNPQSEKLFLAEMLKYGIAVGLWSCNCCDFSVVENKLKNEITKDKKLLDLPNAIKEFRTNQWVNECCDYHLTLFWDDKDRTPPDFKLSEPENTL